jgi:putative transposase
MPRANRHFLPGHIWHITHRCHRRDFLLKVRRDRRTWLSWLLEARRRYGLCVLNYIVTCNHVHLLVRDRGQGEISPAMQLVAGRAAQAYNDRKRRLGAFWQDRYHATAVASDGHLLRCMAYIDLNMVRAGVVSHPAQWPESGYCELQRLPQRYRIIDTAALCRLLECATPEAVRARVTGWTERTLADRPLAREPAWTESLAVGGKSFLGEVKRALGVRARHRDVVEEDDMSCLREPCGEYCAGSPEGGSASASKLITRRVRPASWRGAPTDC